MIVKLHYTFISFDSHNYMVYLYPYITIHHAKVGNKHCVLHMVPNNNIETVSLRHTALFYIRNKNGRRLSFFLAETSTTCSELISLSR